MTALNLLRYTALPLKNIEFLEQSADPFQVLVQQVGLTLKNTLVGNTCRVIRLEGISETVPSMPILTDSRRGTLKSSGSNIPKETAKVS